MFGLRDQKPWSRYVADSFLGVGLRFREKEFGTRYRVDRILTDEGTRKTFLVQAASAAAVVKPSFAAYGDSANVFGKITNTSGELMPSTTPSKLGPVEPNQHISLG